MELVRWKRYYSYKYFDWTKKRIPDPEKTPLPSRELLDKATEKATEKASKLSPQRKTKDCAFMIQRYIACRRGAANGLRHCDINL